MFTNFFDLLGRAVSILSLILMVVGFIMLIRQINKSNRLRASSLFLSMMFSVLMLVFNAFVLRSTGIRWWYVFLLIFGVGFGIAWGKATTVDLKDNKVLGKRSTTYILFWLISLILTQVLALFAKRDVVSFGLVGMFFSTGISMGTNSNILFRIHRVLRNSLPLHETPQSLAVPSKSTKKEPNQRKNKKKILIVGGAIGFLVLFLAAAGLFIILYLSNQEFTLPIKISGEVITVENTQSIDEEQAAVVQETEEPTAVPSKIIKPSATSTIEKTDENPEDSRITDTGTTFFEDFSDDETIFVPVYSQEYMYYFDSYGYGAIQTNGYGGLLPLIIPDMKIQNFSVVFDFMMLDDYEDSSCGIFFRAQGDTSEGSGPFYALFIFPAYNEVFLGTSSDDEWIVSDSLVPSEPFFLGDQYNRIQMDVNLDQMDIYLNDAYVGSFYNDIIQDPGYFGLFFYPSEEKPLIVTDGVMFDNFQLIVE